MSLAYKIDNLDMKNEFFQTADFNATLKVRWPDELDVWFRACLRQKPSIPPQVDNAIWTAWLKASAIHGVSALLYVWLQQAPKEQQPPGAVMAELRAIYIDSLALAERRRLQVNDLVESFEQAGIYPIVLKGAALAQTLYDAAELRPSSDIDLFVGPDQYGNGRCLLIASGYEPLIGDTTPYLHAEPFQHKKHKLSVDLHAAISPYAQVIAAYDPQSLFDNALNFGAMRVLNTEAALNLACLHLINNHRQDCLLIWLYDIHLLANEINKERSWQNVVAASGAWQARYALSQALTLTQHFFGTHFPAFVNDLNQFPPSAEEVKLNQYVGLNQNQANSKYLWLKTHLFQLAGLGNNRARFNYIKNRIVPDKHEIEYFYPQLANWPTPFAYLGRIFLVLWGGNKRR